MNLMHGDIRVTDGIYAPLAGDEVKQRIAGLTGSSMNNPDTLVPNRLTDDELLNALTHRLKGNVRE
jgi:hypothetical protein